MRDFICPTFLHHLLECLPVKLFILYQVTHICILFTSRSLLRLPFSAREEEEEEVDDRFVLSFRSRISLERIISQTQSTTQGSLLNYSVFFIYTLCHFKKELYRKLLLFYFCHTFSYLVSERERKEGREKMCFHTASRSIVVEKKSVSLRRRRGRRRRRRRQTVFS